MCSGWNLQILCLILGKDYSRLRYVLWLEQVQKLHSQRLIIADWDMCSGWNQHSNLLPFSTIIADWDMCSGWNHSNGHHVFVFIIADWDMCSGWNLSEKQENSSKYYSRLRYVLWLEQIKQTIAMNCYYSRLRYVLWLELVAKKDNNGIIIADWDMCSGWNFFCIGNIRRFIIADWDMCSGWNS